MKLAAGRESTQNKLNEIVAIYQKLTGHTLEVAQLHSTGRNTNLVVPFTAVNCRISCKTNTVHSITIFGKGRSHHLCETEHSGNG
ncbi:hypothetical protein ACLB1N_29755 [Escherichia coli]